MRGKPKALTEDQWRRAIDAYLSGVPMKEVAARFRISHSQVTAKVRELGLRKPHKSVSGDAA